MLLENGLCTPTLISIGSGSFGSVYVILGSNIAYKQVHQDGDENIYTFAAALIRFSSFLVHMLTMTLLRHLGF